MYTKNYSNSYNLCFVLACYVNFVLAGRAEKYKLLVTGQRTPCRPDKPDKVCLYASLELIYIQIDDYRRFLITGTIILLIKLIN